MPRAEAARTGWAELQAGLLFGLMGLLACDRGPPIEGRSSRAATRTSSAADAVSQAAPLEPFPDGAPPVRVELVSDLTPLEVRAFRRRSRLRLPRYKAHMQQHAGEHGFDWRLIVAIAYVESHFDPLAKSYTGVRGIMQLTRATAAQMGVNNRLNASQSIRGGVRYLDRLHGHFDEILEFHRTMFAMASYNVGYGHVRDAQRLGRRRGLDPRIWQTLEQTLPLLSNPRIAALTRYGKARGYEPVAYVRSICNYFVLQKQEQCARRQALGRLVLGDDELPPPPDASMIPARLLDEAEDGVVKLTWSHPFVCAMDDCDLFARLSPKPVTTASR